MMGFMSKRKRGFTVSSLVAGTIGTAALLGGGAAAATSIMANRKDKTKPPTQADLPPTPKTAEEKAKEEMLKKRRARDRSGGKTILASQYSGNTDSTTKTLLGQ